MVDIKNIFTAKPPIILDSQLDQIKPDFVNVYVDVKNSAKALYIKEVMAEIVNESLESEKLSSTIFQALIYYGSWWKFYLKQKNIKSRIVFFSDTGESEIYHKEISKKYKQNRVTSKSNYTTLDDKFATIYRSNLELANNILNRLPGVYYIKLKNLESDFVPEFLKTKLFNEPNNINIVCSSDKDMLQLLDDRTYMLFRQNQEDKIVSKTNAILHYSKSAGLKQTPEKLEQVNKIDFKWLEAMMALVGDSIDDIEGVDKFGIAKAVDLFSDNETVSKIIGTPDELFNRVVTKNLFFKEEVTEEYSKKNKLSKPIINAIKEQDTAVKAYKLISFKSLVYTLDNFQTTSRNQIIQEIYTTATKSPETFLEYKTFRKSISNIKDIQLNENHLEAIYY